MKKFITILFLINIQLISQNLLYIENVSGNITKSDYSGNNTTTLISGYHSPYGIAYDLDNNKIYFSSVINNIIYSASDNGTNITALLNNLDDGVSSPRGIVLDGNNAIIYWADAGTGKIKKAGTDGSNVTDVVSGLIAPVDVAIDLTNNKLYWSDNGLTAKKISRSNLDGSNIEDVVVTNIGHVAGITINSVLNKLYYVDYGDIDKIVRTDLDGSNPETILTISDGSPRMISNDNNNNMIVWSDVLKSSISKATLDGGSLTEILSSLSNPLGVATNWDTALPVEIISLTGMPTEFTLEQNFPNPFNPTTIIKFGIPENSHVQLNVYDILGRKVATLIDEVKQAGYYEAPFNASSLVSGLYFYQLITNNYISSKKMMLMK